MASPAQEHQAIKVVEYIRLGAGSELTTEAGAKIDLSDALVILPAGTLPDVFQQNKAGLVPAPGTADATKYLNAAGGFTAPAGTGGGAGGGGAFGYSAVTNLGHVTAPGSTWVDVPGAVVSITTTAAASLIFLLGSLSVDVEPTNRLWAFRWTLADGTPVTTARTALNLPSSDGGPEFNAETFARIPHQQTVRAFYSSTAARAYTFKLQVMLDARGGDFYLNTTSTNGQNPGYEWQGASFLSADEKIPAAPGPQPADQPAAHEYTPAGVGGSSWADNMSGGNAASYVGSAPAVSGGLATWNKTGYLNLPAMGTAWTVALQWINNGKQSPFAVLGVNNTPLYGYTASPDNFGWSSEGQESSYSDATVLADGEHKLVIVGGDGQQTRVYHNGTLLTINTQNAHFTNAGTLTAFGYGGHADWLAAVGVKLIRVYSLAMTAAQVANIAWAS